MDYHITPGAKNLQYKISDINQIALGEDCQ